MGVIEITIFIFLGCLMLLGVVVALLAVGQLEIEAREAIERAEIREAELRRRIERVEHLQGMRIV